MPHLWIDEERKTVREWSAFADLHGMSRSEQCRFLRVSGATLSQVYSETYAGRVARITDQMRRHLRRERLRSLAPQPPPYVKTSVVEEVVRALGIAQMERVIVLLLGPTGVGKSVGIRRYCEAEPDTLLLTAGVGATPWAVLRELAARLELSMHSDLFTLRKCVGHELLNHPRLLVVDEIDYVHEPLVQTLRLLHDDAGIGMAWAGTPAYLERLRARKSATIRQVLGRVKHAVRLPSCSDDDLAGILAPYSLSQAALEAIIDGAHGEARRAVNCIVAAQRMNGHEKISPATIRRAYDTLMPWEEWTP